MAYNRLIARHFRRICALLPLSFAVGALAAAPGRASTLHLPPEAKQSLERMYNGDPDGAIEIARNIQKSQPDHPLGFLLEAEAHWWKIYCEACEVKWGMIDAWKRSKRAGDDAYLALADKGIALAEARLQKSDSAEMHLFAGIGWALKARLLALRDERRPTASTAVKAREHFLRATKLEPNLADAYAGLGLYNYYVDTLSRFVKMLRFFMGIPGGSRREGIRQLELAMNRGELTAVEARFYLAKNLRTYDHEYERAAALAEPLVARYPRNPLFLMLLGNLNAELSRNDKAAASFRAAQTLTISDSACAERVKQVSSSSLAKFP